MTENNQHRLPIECPECGTWFEKTVQYIDPSLDAKDRRINELEGALDDIKTRIELISLGKEANVSSVWHIARRALGEEGVSK